MKSIHIPFTFFIVFSLFFLASCTGNQGINSSSGGNTPQNVVSPSTSTTGNQVSKSVTYRTDHGHHQVTANFVLLMNSDSTIRSVIADMTIGDHESAEYVNNFNTSINSIVSGKKKSELSLSAVGGASDTTTAFMQVINSL